MHPDLIHKNCEEMIEDVGLYISERTPTYQEVITSLSTILMSAALTVDIPKENLIGYLSDLYDAFDEMLNEM